MKHLLLTLSMIITAASLQAELKLARPFADHMVLQREMAVPIWGTAKAGEKVTVSFRGKSKSTNADDKGNWKLSLDALKAGGPDELSVEGESGKLVLKDVLVGEVWVGSGQSNMAGNAGGYAKRDATLAKLLEGAPYPKIRLMKSPHAWTEATPKTAPGFSAILLAFGERLHRELDVPVGLIVGAVGGTPSGMWLSKEAFKADEACQKLVAEAAKKYDPEAAKKQHEVAMQKWEKVVEKLKAEGKKRFPRKPKIKAPPGENPLVGNLYERYIRQVVGYGIRGVLWDQGESGTKVDGVDQYTLMGALIKGWRNEWGQGEFPFIYVQKPSGGGSAWDHENPENREAEKFTPLPAQVPRYDGYRELHTRIRNYPNTYMSTAIDIGPSVHPLNKWGYGNRAAHVALNAVYGGKGVIYGPTYASHTVDGNKLVVKFDNVGKGLAFKNGDQLQGFAIAGEDGVYHWADARIDGDSVALTSEKVEKPISAMYGWTKNRRWANLFNKDGLPALAFRTESEE